MDFVTIKQILKTNREIFEISLFDAEIQYLLYFKNQKNKKKLEKFNYFN